FADDGTFTAPADVKASSFISSSDERLKTDVRPAEGLAKVLRIEGVTFRWLKDRSPGMGFLAQAVEKIFPDIVVTNPTTGLKGIR
ncbi:tail fiber domain-containing protein, partial [Escherichia coli]|uniref:tail fiber domain-containing protein n=1 Tax=Escherichia coli TaxID=562 RepID=UPI0027380686